MESGRPSGGEDRSGSEEGNTEASERIWMVVACVPDVGGAPIRTFSSGLHKAAPTSEKLSSVVRTDFLYVRRLIGEGQGEARQRDRERTCGQTACVWVMGGRQSTPDDHGVATFTELW